MENPSTTRLADAIARAAETVNASDGVEDRLRAVVQAAPGTVPGFDLASISLTFGDDAVETRAATNELVEQLDAAQYAAAEGPCFDAFSRHEAIIVVPVMRHEQRWPAYVPHALDAGVAAQMAVPLRDGKQVRGALNLYSTTGEGIHAEAVDIATLFATHVALTLGWARTQEQLTHALETRKMIGEAVGVVMERYQINEEKAFAFLARVSMNGNVKLRDVAQQLVTQTDTRYTIKDDA